MTVESLIEQSEAPRLHGYPNHRRFGPDSIAIFQRTIEDPQVMLLLEKVIATNFTKQFGMQGEQFVRYCFEQFAAFAVYGTVGEIHRAFSRTRIRFRQNHLRYGESKSRYARLQLELVSRYLKGQVLDIGANDNSLGENLLYLKADVQGVTGVDIEKRTGIKTNDRLHFQVQTDSSSLPRPDCSADSIIIKHSLHHMTVAEQMGILSDCHRCLMQSGYLIVYEDTYSFELPPLNDPDSLYEQILELGTTSRIRLLLASMDAWPKTYKQKRMPFPNTYRTIEEWEELFGNLDYEVVKRIFYGIPNEGFGAAPLGIFVLRNARTRG